MNKFYLIPKTGLTVRREEAGSGSIPPEGEELQVTRYYRRLIRDGDLIVYKPEKPREQKTGGKT